MQALKLENMTKMHAAQLRALTIAQMPVLLDEQRKVYDIKLMSIFDIKQLTPQYVADLSVCQIWSLTKEQISATISLECIKAITPECMCDLNKAQLRALTPA